MRREPLVKKKANDAEILVPILRVVAILVAAVSVFVFFLKLLFF